MSFLRTFFSVDKCYKETLKKYEFKDGILAIAIYIIVFVVSYVGGIAYDKINIYLGNQINIFTAILCILCVIIRHQPISTLGFSKNNFFKSLILGLCFSSILLTIILAYGISEGYKSHGVSQLIQKFGYYFFVIALVEEILFRGFIQTRIYGIIKKPVFAVLVTAFMFMVIHIPFQMHAAKMGLIPFFIDNYITLICTFLWHIVFNFMYTKYNSIIAPTVFHAFMDWCNDIFII